MKKRNIAILICLFLGALFIDVPYLFDVTWDKVENLNKNRKVNKIKFYTERYQNRDIGDKKGKFKDLTKLIKLETNNKSKQDLYLERADFGRGVYDDQGKIDDLYKAIAVYPSRENHKIYNRIAYSKEFLGDIKGGIEAYENAISNTNDLERAIIYTRNIALLKTRLGDYKGAIEGHSAALYSIETFSWHSDKDKPPLTPYIISRIYSARALNKSKVNDKKGALDDCLRAIEIDPNNSECRKIAGYK